jgi:hypothetical protein
MNVLKALALIVSMCSLHVFYARLRLQSSYFYSGWHGNALHWLRYWCWEGLSNTFVCSLLERPNLFAICNNTFSKLWEG